jgi:hypothetical protein
MHRVQRLERWPLAMWRIATPPCLLTSSASALAAAALDPRLAAWLFNATHIFD